MNTLDGGGTCQKCKKDAQKENMECWMCRNRFHVIDCEGEENMVQPSFLRNQWPTLAKKWFCITFTCHNCREDTRTKEDHIMSQRVRHLEEMALKTSEQLNHITDMLSKKDDATPSCSGMNYAAVASNKEAPALIIVEKPEDESTDEERKNKMQELKKAAIQSKASVKKSFSTKSGKTVLVLSNEKSKEAMLPHVNKLFATSKINTPVPKLPTISIPFIEGNFEKGELIEALNNQNEDNGLFFDADNAQVIFISPMKDQGNDGLHQAVIRVSEELRERIKANGNRIFLGSSSCPVYDRFFVKRCNSCQGFHHFHRDCKKNQICGKCAGKHDTRQCEADSTSYKCINCAIGGFANTNHMASSYNCPAYIAEQEKLKKSIHFYSKNSQN